MINDKQKPFIYVLMFLIDIIMAFLNANLFLIISSLLIYCFGKKDFKKQELLMLLFFDAFLILAILLDIIKFDFMPQANDLLEKNTSVLFWISQKNKHAVRLLVAYPGYLLSCTAGVGLDKGFTVYIGLLFQVVYIYIYKILKLYIQEVWTTGFVFIGFMSLLLLIINGRMIFAYLGSLIIIYEDIYEIIIKENKRKWKWLKLGVGILLTTVSSGTMLLMLGYIGLMFIIKYLCSMSVFNKVRAAAWGMFFGILSIPIWSRGLKYVIRMVRKNITYFGGHIVNMLNHGAGKIIYFSDTRFHFVYFVLLAGVLLVNVLLFEWLIIKRQWEKVPLYLMANLGIYGLAVGISTGTMMLIPLLILILININKIVIPIRKRSK